MARTPWQPRKYRNKPVRLDGYYFRSQREARRYQELKLLENGGAIRNLECQPRYPLIVGRTKICTYVGDFRYMEGGKTVVEDAKGYRTRDYVIKKNLMKALYAIDIREI